MLTRVTGVNMWQTKVRGSFGCMGEKGSRPRGRGTLAGNHGGPGMSCRINDHLTAG